MSRTLRAELWIRDGRNLLGLGENSASWIAHLFKHGAEEIEVVVEDDDIDNVYAVRVTLPTPYADQKLFLVNLVSLRPRRVEASLDDTDPNVVWLHLPA